jgi:riboflavin-specific deaminase-like protein
VVKYAQSLDGRIATAAGDSRWISGEEERRISHALRAACDAILVGVQTVIRDDPQLTVRMVPGHSPARVVLDSRLRSPMDARIFDDGPGVIVLTTDRAPRKNVLALRRRGVAVRAVDRGSRGVDVRAALRALREMGIGSLLVEGGARVITSILAEEAADRLIVGLAPTVIGSGTEAVGDLGVERVAEGLRLADRAVHLVGEDVLVAGDVVPRDADVQLRPSTD